MKSEIVPKFIINKPFNSSNIPKKNQARKSKDNNSLLGNADPSGFSASHVVNSSNPSISFSWKQD